MNITLDDIFKGITLYNYTENHKKFWTIQYNDETRVLTRTWGRIGTTPQVMEEQYFRTAALSKADDLILQKYAKGYRLESEMLSFFLNRQ